MKIKIVQREIEEAVRDYIHKQIAVREGHEITMDFSATRGDDGLIADIDISPTGTVASSPKSAAAPAEQVTVRETTVAPKQTVTRRLSTPAAVEPAVVEAAPTSVSTEVEETVVETDVQSAYVADIPEKEEVPGEQPLRSSIFSGLRRPSNSDESAAA